MSAHSDIGGDETDKDTYSHKQTSDERIAWEMMRMQEVEREFVVEDIEYCEEQEVGKQTAKCPIKDAAP